MGLRGLATSPKGQRRLVIVNGLVFVAIAVEVAALSHGPWRWPIFAVGLAFGVLGATVQFSLARWAARQPQAIPDRRAEAQSRTRVFMLYWVLVGGALGICGGGLDRWWVVVVGMVFIATVYAAGVVRALLYVRRSAGG
jgi:fatty acid desaturase